MTFTEFIASNSLHPFYQLEIMWNKATRWDTAPSCTTSIWVLGNHLALLETCPMSLKIKKSTTLINLHYSFTETKQLPKSHMLVVLICTNMWLYISWMIWLFYNKSHIVGVNLLHLSSCTSDWPWNKILNGALRTRGTSWTKRKIGNNMHTFIHSSKRIPPIKHKALERIS